MITLHTARQLKDAGLIWQTTIHDFFAVPEGGLEDRVFVLTDIMAYTELLRGWPVVAFHGTAEWALDYIYTSEVVWLPTEEQLRDALATRLSGDEEGSLTLELTSGGYLCTIASVGQIMSFPADTASEAYAAALLQLLRRQDGEIHE